jgi:hypothetical protein
VSLFCELRLPAAIEATARDPSASSRKFLRPNVCTSDSVWARGMSVQSGARAMLSSHGSEGRIS